MSGSGPVVDVHVHGIPRRLVARVRERSIAGVSVQQGRDGTASFGFPDMEPSPPAPEGLFDLPAIAAWGRGQGIDLQLVGPWTDLLGYTLPSAEAEAWSELYNEALAEACADVSGLLALGTIPLQAPEAALRVLTSARVMGCRGFVIGTDVPGHDLEAASLDPVWAALSAAHMPVLVHPTFLSVSPDLRLGGLKNAVGRAAATTLAVARLVYGGVLERHPGLTLIMAHGGGGFVPLIDRVVRSHELGWSSSAADVADSIGRLYWDSVVLDPRYLAFVVQKVGAGRVLLGSDHPFPWEPEPVTTVEQAVGLAERSAILGETARSLFGIGV
jgi:aminocarboxymuconate-semialdehyde decarboxylase